jgi:hypothetical protein
MTAVARLPGIVFEVEPRQPRTLLPRMDIAAFVGFASSGPLHLPVAVEDRGRFRELFGADPTLAWDAERGVPQPALLGGAVDGFFRNGGRRCWVVRVGPADMPVREIDLPGLVPAGVMSAGGLGDAVKARARSPGRWADGLLVDTQLRRERLGLQSVAIDPDGEGGWRYSLQLDRAPDDWSPGELLELDFGDALPRLYLFVDALEAVSVGVILTGARAYWYEPLAGSPPQGQATWERVDEAAAVVDFQLWQSSSPAPNLPSVYRVRFSLGVRLNDTEWRLADLAFHPEHPRAWQHLPDDATLFARDLEHSPQSSDRGAEVLHAEASFPRFPLAGPEGALEPSLPLGMDALAADLDALDRAPGDSTRPDIAEYGSDLFLDDRLQRLGSGALLGEAERRYYLLHQPLSGLHSLLTIEEITLIAVPDAVHLGWSRVIRDLPEPLEAPELEPIPAWPDASGRYLIRWSAIAGATAYRLEYGTTPELDRPNRLDLFGRVLSLDETLIPPPALAEIELPADCPRPHYFRVRALRDGVASPWSGTRGRILPAVDFVACLAQPIDEVELLVTPLASPPDAGVQLSWSLVDPDFDAPDAFELQVASDLGFQSGRIVNAGTHTSLERPLPLNAAQYYRVRGVRAGRHGPWSNSVSLEPSALATSTLESVSDFDAAQVSGDSVLLDVHRALIRCCAARGDLWACLSLPRHYRAAQVREHLRQLLPRTSGATPPTVSAVPPLSLGERPSLSYAGLFHPWPGVRLDETAAISPGAGLVAYGPPDGAILGQMARQAVDEGAWLAPANMAYRHVIALDPSFSEGDWRDLTALGVNLIRPDPRGWLLLNAETLSPGAELRQISVRRLLILLRRLALREGRGYVFEPNSQDFRDLVQHRFEQLLSQLYARGAFAGDTPTAAYRVVVDDSVNPPRSLELGRFVVELRVAPSQPLQFITVRLVQSGAERLALEEV